MPKLRSFLPLFVLALCSLSSAVALHAAPQVMRNAPVYTAPGNQPRKHAKRRLKAMAVKKSSGAMAALVGYGTPNIQSDVESEFEDKVRMDGSTPPFQILLTNISEDLSITFSGASFDNPAYTATTTCTTLAPGQTCTYSIHYTPAGICIPDDTTLTITDNDPETDDGGNGDAPGTLTYLIQSYGADNNMTLDDLTDSKLSATALAQA